MNANTSKNISVLPVAFCLVAGAVVALFYQLSGNSVPEKDALAGGSVISDPVPYPVKDQGPVADHGAKQEDGAGGREPDGSAAVADSGDRGMAAGENDPAKSPRGQTEPVAAAGNAPGTDDVAPVYEIPDPAGESKPVAANMVVALADEGSGREKELAAAFLAREKRFKEQAAQARELYQKRVKAMEYLQ